jgi:serine/threonine-protein kinase
MSLERIGKYRVVAKIGEGAMGEVYKAHDPLLNRYVALKTISPALAADPQFRERFQREAQSAAQLNHPNIITVFDFGEEAGLTYMAMEFLEGVDLREAIRARMLGHLGRKIEVMEQLCEGVGFAHARGVVHRDLKPGNVHIQPSGHIKVLDFGLARLGGSDMTKTGTVMGTPHYMSPEQVRGQKADARSDVFSLGAIFYELLTGARAFEGRAMHEVLQRIRDHDPVPLRRRAPATPAALAALVDRAMARDAEARFKDAGEMGRALAHAREELAGETLVAPGAREDKGERTLLQAAGETLVEQRPRPRIVGTSALDVGGQHEPPRTLRPDATVAGPATEVRRFKRARVVGAVVLALGAVAAAVGLWPRAQSPASPPPTAARTQDELGMITDVVVTGKLELARADLDNRDYASAAATAREALGLDPHNAEAQALLEQAERTQRELDAAVARARAAVARGATGEGQQALSRVLALDPRHAVVAELSDSLNQAFRQEAEAARRRMAETRASAEKARAAGMAEYAAAGKLSTAAEDHFRRAEFTIATQKFLASRDGFEAARRGSEAATAEAARAAEAARQAALAAAVAQPRPTLPPPVSAPAPPPPTLAAPSPSALPTLAPTARPTVAAGAPGPSPTLALPAAPAADARIAEIERVLAGYERAYESLDVSALRSVMDLSPQQEKGLRDAFKAFKSYGLEMSHNGVAFEGDGRATVRVSRQDIINGEKKPPKTQVFVLGRQGGSWRIVSYSFER